MKSMEIIRDIKNFIPEGPSAISIGKFDGIHQGHRRLLEELSEFQGNRIVMIIDTDSDYLTDLYEREYLLKAYQIDYVMECPLTGDFAALSHQNFLNELLLKQLKVQKLIVGSDFRFGAGAMGDTEYLKRESQGRFQLSVIEKLKYGNTEISSTLIRKLIHEGDVITAGELLCGHYAFRGTVEHGAALGRTIAYPTANLRIDRHKVLPLYGVYLAEILLPDGTTEQGICNIGERPTVSDTREPLLEMHIFWFKGDLYGETVTVKLLDFLRPEQKFNDLSELEQQLKIDEMIGKLYFTRNTGNSSH